MNRSRITILHLSTGTNICDEGITSLLAYTWSNCLQRIDASHCEAITNIGISVIATRCAQSLQKIQLSRCTGVSDDGIAILAQHCPRLRYVDVRRLKNLTDKGAYVHSEKQRHKTHTHTHTESKHFTYSTRQFLVSRTYYELETLILKRCSKITDKAFEVLDPDFNVCILYDDEKNESPKPLEIKLAHLDIAQCRNLTDVTLKRVSRCERLDTIKVESLDRITDEGVLHLASSCPRLRVVDFMSVRGVRT